MSMVEEELIASLRDTEEVWEEEEEKEGGKDAADIMVVGPYPSSFAAGRDEDDARRAGWGEGESLFISSPLLFPLSSLLPSSSSPLSKRGGLGGNT